MKLPHYSLLILGLAIVLGNCARDTEKPVPTAVVQQVVENRVPCDITFTSSDLLTVCGTLTNVNACSVCGNPNLGKLRGVEVASSGTYTLSDNTAIQFTNTTGNPVSIKIRDNNGVVQGFLIPSGSRLVAYIDAACNVTGVIC